MSKNKKNIHVPILTRVEGEGALSIDIKDNIIERLELQIYEPPRLFEKFLEGRHYSEILDIVARICGICPVAYQMSAVQAIESCFGVQIDSWVRNMRRLFYCGEWMESHSLHIHFLAAPDFLGFKSAPEMAKVYPEEIRRGLRLQAFGNAIISLFGGRSVHPVGACIGGFYKAPSPAQIEDLLSQIPDRITDCEHLITWTATLPKTDNSHHFTSVSLRHPDEYPMNEGNIVSNQSLDIPINQFDNFFKEYQVPYSNALHCLLQGEPYLVGPLARVNNNYDHLPEPIKETLSKTQISFPSHNMHLSIVARAVEIYYCVLEVQRLLQQYAYSDKPHAEFSPKAGRGYGCTEAPRGMLWHFYEMEPNGLVKSARIVPPTSQNQARIEADLRLSLYQYGLNKQDDDLQAYCEQIIRNYDPCISCSTHFLNLRVHRHG